MATNYQVRIDTIQKIAKHLKYLMLAEGDAEAGLISSILNELNADPNEVKIYCFEGVNKMAKHVGTIVKLGYPDPDDINLLKGICLIADSDNNPAGRVASIIEIAKAFSFTHCGKDLDTNSYHVSDDRVFAFSLSPSKDSSGRIETLILEEIAGSPNMDCIDSMLPCIAAANGIEMDEKAKVQIYISAVSNSSMAGIKHAFAGKMFDCNHSAYALHVTAVKRALGLTR